MSRSKYFVKKRAEEKNAEQNNNDPYLKYMRYRSNIQIRDIDYMDPDNWKLVYVIIYLQDFSQTETRTFTSAKAMLTYCFNKKKANYVKVEESYDSSFDYFVHLEGYH